MGFATRAAESAAVLAEPSPTGSTVVAVPVVHEDRVACVVVLDMRSSAPPVESDAATIRQITALFARVADREWTASASRRPATRRWSLPGQVGLPRDDEPRDPHAVTASSALRAAPSPPT